MSNSRSRRVATLAAALLGAGGIVVTAGPVASAAPATTLQVGCGGSSYPTIGGALSAANPGDTIVVCPGTYGGGVMVDKAVTLIGQDATVDATGADTGFTVSASGATVEGFTVENATGEGILVSAGPGQPPVSHVTISGNTVMGNDQGNPNGQVLTQTDPPTIYPECVGAGPVPGDCGEGIHLMSATHSTVSDNVVENNTGGILLTDEFGPTAFNDIVGNTVEDNVWDCGVTVAGHNIASLGGVYDNQIVGNTISGNGTSGQGAGVLLATGVPAPPGGVGGAVYGNLVSGNDIWGNGLAGVTIHSHAVGEDLNNNTIVNNTIGTNNLNPDFDFVMYGNDYYDAATTGVIVATLSNIHVTIANNTITGNTDGVWIGEVGGASVSATGIPSNTLAPGTTPVVTVTS